MAVISPSLLKGEGSSAVSSEVRRACSVTAGAGSGSGTGQASCGQFSLAFPLILPVPTG